MTSAAAKDPVEAAADMVRLTYHQYANAQAAAATPAPEKRIRSETRPRSRPEAAVITSEPPDTRRNGLPNATAARPPIPSSATTASRRREDRVARCGSGRSRIAAEMAIDEVPIETISTVTRLIREAAATEPKSDPGATERIRPKLSEVAGLWPTTSAPSARPAGRPRSAPARL